MLEYLKHIAARHFSGEFRNVDSYTPDELSRAKEALLTLGYQADTNKEAIFRDLAYNYIKRNEKGKVTGAITFYTDKEERAFNGMDGIVSVFYDEALIKKNGDVTTIHDFAFKMNPTATQKAIIVGFPFLKP